MPNSTRRRDHIPDGLLFIGGDSAEGTAVLDALTGECQPRVERALSLAQGLARLTRPGISSILLMLRLPDSCGIETFDRIAAAAGPIPIVVLCGVDDECTGRLAVERGADDFLLANHFDRYSLTRAAASLRDDGVRGHALFDDGERAAITLDSIGDAVVCTDPGGSVTYLNETAEAMTGWSRADAAGRPLQHVCNIVDVSSGQRSPNPAEVAVERNTTVTLTETWVLIRRDGHESAIEHSTAPIHDRAGRITGSVIVLRDVSAARQLSKQLAHLAQHDALTDLPNRLLVRDRLQQAISLARRHARRAAALFVDLDRFKQVNDSLGHLVGDQLLKQVAARLTSAMRDSDTVGRQGGDEFVIVLCDLESAAAASTVAAKVLAVLRAPYQVGVHALRVPASVGISVYPDDARDAETLLGCADTAMYCAKDKGRNNMQSFKQEMVGRAAERQFLEDGLRVALERREFALCYQPQIDLATQAVVGAEALLRWRHPQRGWIPPAQFIPVAEETGLILPIGLWVLREACRQSREWLEAGLPAVPMAVNVSAIEFRSPDFAETIRDTLRDTEMDPLWLELELTESALTTHTESTVALLHALKTIGVRLAVDDFGTGNSSLSYLRQFPIDRLKVDRSFVREIPGKPDGAVAVRAAINMGASLNTRVIAEGVENRLQAEFLAEEGCAEAQGNYFRHPMQARYFGALLGAGIWRVPVQ